MSVQCPVCLYDLVVDSGLISEEELRPFSEFTNDSLYSILKFKFKVPERQLFELVSVDDGYLVGEASQLIPDPDLSQVYSKQVLKNNRFFPLYETDDEYCIVTDSPFSPFFTQLKTDKEIVTMLISSRELDKWFSLQEGCLFTKSDPLEDVLTQAVSKRASDIHIHQLKSDIVIQLRIDGELSELARFGDLEAQSFCRILKLRADLDISLDTVPQDGRISMAIGHVSYDFRVASLPTVYGEDFVIRVFDPKQQLKTLDELGFDDETVARLEGVLGMKGGLVLVTGPTGSGKTTTLYSFLDWIVKHRKGNVVTLEDPVERVIDGVRQSPLNLKVQYGFAEGLKAVLRQDPDVIMIGEIRDKKTAQIALEAAYTGHLVLSTLHTSDVKSSLHRLRQFDLDSFLLLYSIRGILSQSLEPKVCELCQGAASACRACGYTGYRGRTLHWELLTPPEFSEPRDIEQTFESWFCEDYFLSQPSEPAKKQTKSALNRYFRG